MIVTHEASLATQFVRDIRGELEGNERILVEYGDLCSEEGAKARRDEGTKGKKSRRKWADSMFTTETGITVQAKGTGAGVRGLRRPTRSS